MEMPGKAFKTGTVEAAGFTLDYAEAGPPNPKATIVSLPGSAGLEMSLAKDKLAETYRVVEINPPGWGGKEDMQREHTHGELGAILAEAADKLVNGPYFVIGTSAGGINSIYLAAKVPERILGIILEGSMAPCRHEDLYFPAMTKEQIEGMAVNVERGGSYPVPPPSPKKPWATTEYIGTQMKNRFKMFRWIADNDFTAEPAISLVRSRKIPVLAMLGDEDQILKPSQEEALKTALPQARFQIVRGGEHDLQNTATDEFVQLVEAFIAETRVSA